MANKREAKATIRRLLRWYKNGIPSEVLAAELKIDQDEAQSLIEYFETEEKKEPVEQPKPTVSVTQKVTKMITKKKLKWEATSVIRWVMLVLSIPALILSAYFSVDTLSTQLPDFASALLMGITLIAFATVAFEAMVLYKRQKNKMYIIFGGIWILLMSFSATSIITSLYNNYLENIQEQRVENTISQSNSKQIEEIDKIIQSKETEITRIQNSSSGFQKTIDDLDTLEEQKANYWYYNTAITSLNKANENISKLNSEIETQRNKKEELLKENPNLLISEEKKVSSYEWIGNIFGWDSAFTQFIMQVIPALSLDLIASLALYVFFFPSKKVVQRGQKQSRNKSRVSKAT